MNPINNIDPLLDYLMDCLIDDYMEETDMSDEHFNRQYKEVYNQNNLTE